MGQDLRGHVVVKFAFTGITVGDFRGGGTGVSGLEWHISGFSIRLTNIHERLSLTLT